MMEVTVEGHTITAQELQSDDWTPVLYKAYSSRPASSPKPPHHPGNATSEGANPNARNAVHDTAAATRSGKTPARLPPATKETRLTVQRSKQLPPLPHNAIRVDVRPRGKLQLLDVPTPRLRKAVQTQLRITLPDDFYLRTHPTNNTFTMATTHVPTDETLKTLTSLAIGDQTYPCTAYVAPPPWATRGVMTNAYDDEYTTQLYQDLVRINSEYTILAARHMEKTHSILITFDANAVPHSMKYMGAIHRCTLYRGSPDACTNCRQPGHCHDICPSPKTNLCPRCGTQHPQQDPPCTPKCILCEGRPHLTATRSCKEQNLQQPRKQPRYSETQHQESVPPRDSFPQLSFGPTQPNQHKQARTEPLKQAWNTPLSSHKHTTSMTVNPSLQQALAKSQEEAAAAKAEATAARAEAAALRQCVAKLDAQINTPRKRMRLIRYIAVLFIAAFHQHAGGTTYGELRIDYYKDYHDYQDIVRCPKLNKVLAQGILLVDDAFDGFFGLVVAKYWKVIQLGTPPTNASPKSVREQAPATKVNYMKSTSTLGEPGQVTTIAKSENRTMGPTFNAGDFPSVANAQTKASGWVRAVSEPLFAFPFQTEVSLQRQNAELRRHTEIPANKIQELEAKVARLTEPQAQAGPLEPMQKTEPVDHNTRPRSRQDCLASHSARRAHQSGASPLYNGAPFGKF
ncbi:hypothetical protein HPB49_006554 [Dermacentor silvarum]|uniref:Uncharacterized protein n=1 Tax=Dermacentor silvarum TaxID=543639 RepID=A0ACB8CVG8_DERSI|nr:hypothetical protein HPB49_006554 [Dermacentor silvarum]